MTSVGNATVHVPSEFLVTVDGATSFRVTFSATEGTRTWVAGHALSAGVDHPVLSAMSEASCQP